MSLAARKSLQHLPFFRSPLTAYQILLARRMYKESYCRLGNKEFSELDPALEIDLLFLAFSSKPSERHPSLFSFSS
jgi:hypothetical protein